MVSPRLRSRSYRKLQVRTPGARTVTHYEKKNKGSEKCAVCKKPLRGFSRLTPRKFKNQNKTQKQVSRKYGGYMCHKCLAKELKSKVFNSTKE